MMRTAITSRVRFARALRSREFAWLWAGQSVSSLGDGAYLTALAWEVLLLTGSATAMGIVEIAALAPSLVFLLLGGVVADRFERRRVLFWSDCARALAVPSSSAPSSSAPSSSAGAHLR